MRLRAGAPAGLSSSARWRKVKAIDLRQFVANMQMFADIERTLLDKPAGAPAVSYNALSPDTED